jgi:hypothetical protein
MGFIPFSSRSTKKLFKKLDANKATGNDKKIALILKRLADVLAIPFTKIVRRLFYEACWPAAWKYHLLVPIFKKVRPSCLAAIEVFISQPCSPKRRETYWNSPGAISSADRVWREPMGDHCWAELSRPGDDADDVVDPGNLQQQTSSCISE